jgi:hypothetical protein
MRLSDVVQGEKGGRDNGERTACLDERDCLLA